MYIEQRKVSNVFIFILCILDSQNFNVWLHTCKSNFIAIFNVKKVHVFYTYVILLHSELSDFF